MSTLKRENNMLILDRFEEGFAVIEDGGKMLTIKRALLPANAKEGDVLTLENKTYKVDENATKARREMILKKMRKLGL